jgi:hypothetical protein
MLDADNRPENKLYRYKSIKMKLQRLAELKHITLDLDQVQDLNNDFYRTIEEKKRLEDGICELEKFVDRKRNFTLVEFNSVLLRRNYIGVNSKTIKKNGYAKLTAPLTGKTKAFCDGIYKKVAEQNRKVKHGVFYDVELLFFKNGKQKCGDNIIMSVIREENGESKSMVWVGFIEGRYCIFY